MRDKALVLALVGGGCLVAIALTVVAWPALRLVLSPRRAGGSYYLPSESMLPTLARNDRIVPMRLEGDLRRGDVIVFHGPDTVRISRVIGLPGDRVALKAGLVSIDGQAAARENLMPGPRLDGGVATMVQIERLPGEAGRHALLDIGAGPGDEVAPVTVPPERLFVLGDDRDAAADSRFGADRGGVGMVPRDHVIGVVTATLWSSRARRVGDRIDDLDRTILRKR